MLQVISLNKLNAALQHYAAMKTQTKCIKQFLYFQDLGIHLAVHKKSAESIRHFNPLKGDPQWCSGLRMYGYEATLMNKIGEKLGGDRGLVMNYVTIQ